MFGAIGLLLKIGLAAAAAAIGYWQARRFTENKLRYVDAIHNALVPFGAGLAAALVAMPVVALLPIVGGATALLFGGGVAAGVSSGARNIRKRLGA